MANDIKKISATRLRDHTQDKRLLASAIVRGSEFAMPWAHIGSISATDYVYIGGVPEDCEVVAVYAGAEDLVSDDGDETYTLIVYKDDACDAAAGTAVIDTLTLTRATDDGVIKTAVVKTDGAEDIDASTHRLLKAVWTLGGTTPSAVNPWITVILRMVSDPTA